MPHAIFDRLTALTAPLLAGLAGAGSAAVLIAALVFQYFGVAPCDLCITQRWPHLLAALLGAALMALRLPAAVFRAGALAGAGAAALTGAIGVYHSGVERGLFEGPDSCTSGPVGTLSAQDLLAQIQAAPLIRCDEIAWQMWGVTMPNLNAIASFAFAALWIAAFVRARSRA